MIRGRMTSPPVEGEAWWVRVDGVFLNTRREARIQKDGSFEAGGLDMGAYLISVFEGGRLRHVQRVEIDTNRQVTEVTFPEGGGKGK